MITLTGTCRICHTPDEIVVPEAHYEAWRNGALIQIAMPDLTPGQREFVISQTCDACFTKLFGEDD